MSGLPTAVPDDDFVDFGKASWALQPGSTEGERQLYGEIGIPQTITPTFTFGSTFDLKVSQLSSTGSICILIYKYDLLVFCRGALVLRHGFYSCGG